MLRSFYALSLLLVLTGCAQERLRQQAEVHEAEVKKETKAAEFDGHCGLNLCLKKNMVKCDPNVTLEYKGKNYCFVDTDARDKFIEKIEYNLRSANEQWMIMGPR